MRKKTVSWGLCLLALASLPSCGGTSPTSPSAAANVNGSYAGSLVDSLDGQGSLSLAFSQNGNSLTGTFQQQFAPGNVAGSINGAVSGVSLSAVLTPSPVPTSCSSTLTGTISNGGSHIEGTYVVSNCAIAAGGTFSVNRQ